MLRLLSRSRFVPTAFAVTALSIGSVASAQLVVDVDHNAGTGYYANWGAGNADASTPPSSSYNNYRKGGANTPPGLPTVSDDGNGTSATWVNLSHGGGLPCCGNPGMFFGESASSSSYADAQLFLGNNIEVGNAQENDSNGHRRFDLRFGFTESPSDWISGKAADSGAFDLWTGDHGSDTIYLQTQLGSTDSVADAPVADTANGGNLVAADNKFVYINQSLMGQAGGDGTLGDERNRDRWFKNEQGISTGAPTVVDESQPELNLELTGNGLGTSLDTGVAYEDNVSVDWWMELNDGENADPVLAREVKFSIQFGNLTYSQVFDPGGTDLGSTADDVVPNPSQNSTAFDDGFFDWENAYPVFFVAPNGGSGNGSTAPVNSLTMGFTAPDDPMFLEGDFDGNGSVGDGDLTLLLSNWGGAVPPVPAGWDGAQPTAPGVGDDELTALLGTWGASQSGVAVPEPASVLVCLGLLGSATLLRSRRRA
ncbi:hypothetical protein MalM25_21570 [Planctomycetes bacterium MalM25]|nr:hypothetical protein MalM25_21570 [Planctomycetes bacterium MalM25]